ncbi:MAG: hypothetical protein J3K34DRAFT_500244 [Monoraphidium minutum]|nr:MAG: hypothetical protein J3K34DRAFT_500244 [Monoraphidium minutum]
MAANEAYVAEHYKGTAILNLDDDPRAAHREPARGVTTETAVARWCRDPAVRAAVAANAVGVLRRAAFISSLAARGAAAPGDGATEALLRDLGAQIAQITGGGGGGGKVSEAQVAAAEVWVIWRALADMVALVEAYRAQRIAFAAAAALGAQVWQTASRAAAATAAECAAAALGAQVWRVFGDEATPEREKLRLMERELAAAVATAAAAAAAVAAAAALPR